MRTKILRILVRTRHTHIYIYIYIVSVQNAFLKAPWYSPRDPKLRMVDAEDIGRLSFRGFTITLFRHATLGRTPLDE
jgi:hypothetical protein